MANKICPCAPPAYVCGLHQPNLSAAVQTLETLAERYKARSRVFNSEGNQNLDAYYDGKATGIREALYELQHLPRQREDTTP